MILAFDIGGSRIRAGLWDGSILRPAGEVPTPATDLAAFIGALASFAMGSGAGAAVYAMHCTESSPLFYVTWYGLAILFVTTVSALIGRRILRW